MAALPEKARVVIIGQGGIVGASVAHHLMKPVGMTSSASKSRRCRRTLARPPMLLISAT